MAMDTASKRRKNHQPGEQECVEVARDCEYQTALIKRLRSRPSTLDEDEVRLGAEREMSQLWDSADSFGGLEVLRVARVEPTIRGQQRATQERLPTNLLLGLYRHTSLEKARSCSHKHQTWKNR